jgi:hypothetical protein
LSNRQHGDDAFDAAFASGCKDVKHACWVHLGPIKDSAFSVCK